MAMTCDGSMLELQFLKLTDTLNGMQSRLESLQEQVDGLPDRIWQNLDNRGAMSPGISTAPLVQTAIKALTDAILQSVNIKTEPTESTPTFEPALIDPEPATVNIPPEVEDTVMEEDPPVVEMPPTSTASTTSSSSSDEKSDSVMPSNSFLAVSANQGVQMSTAPLRLKSLRPTPRHVPSICLPPSAIRMPELSISWMSNGSNDMPCRKRKSSSPLVSKKIHKTNQDRDNDFAFFEWSDGTMRLAPQDWHFPKVSCRSMWRFWFRGDSTRRICPFRRLTSRDLATHTTRRAKFWAKHVMEKLIQLAISHGAATSVESIEASSDSALMCIFDTAFEAFLQSIPRSTKRPPSHLSTCFAVFYTLHRKKKPTMAHDEDQDGLFQWTDGSKRRAPEGWTFPVISCRTLWHRWYLGDDTAHIGPYQFLAASDLSNEDSRRHRQQAEAIMLQLAQIAVAKGLVDAVEHMDVLAPGASDLVLQQSLAVLVKDLACEDVGNELNLTYETVWTAMEEEAKQVRSI
ncbi:hypothetical protein LEN26_000718 [Aphanomyces euteiches]|nr:hypothetical protein LEN26_000718 [Aphanomyces euteiches]KAH9191878.1 hypothetical protein AeNC1_006145 [Aphanomyces euteiches]